MRLGWSLEASDETWPTTITVITDDCVRLVRTKPAPLETQELTIAQLPIFWTHGGD